MADSWAISGRDLHVDIGTTRVRESLERALRDAVRSGRLSEGSLLPPSRALAGDLGIARNTVAEAYAQLVAEGWLTARQGSGTRVAGSPAMPPHDAGAPPGRTSPRLPYDLRAGHPDVSGFPRSAWLAAARAALSRAPAEAFGYGDPQGRVELRRALAEYLARARGVQVTPDRVVVCSGFTQALGLLAGVLREQGAGRIGVESHGHRLHRRVLAEHGLRLTGLPVDDLGARPDDLDSVDALLLTPAHQFPLGVALAAERRSAFTRWAGACRAWIVEDDYDGEFRYDRRPVGALQALAPEQVVYAGTASKTVAPAVRLAWLVLPHDLVEPVVERQALLGATAPALDQLTLAEMVGSGGYDRHVRRSRHAYRRRRDHLVRTLARRHPELDVRGLPAGLHALLDLPPDVDGDDVVRRAADRGLAVETLDAYADPADPRPPALVIGYATPPPHAYTSAVARLCATLADVRDHPSPASGSRHDA